MPKSPTEKALLLLRANRWTPRVVEVWNDRLKCRQDLFGLYDIMAWNPRVGCPTLALQVTAADGGGVAERVAKLLADPLTHLHLQCNYRVEVWGMRKTPVKGSGLKARTLVLNEDGTIRVEEGSLALESVST